MTQPRKRPQDRKPRTRRASKPEIKRLDIACGKRKEADWFGIDLTDDSDADLVHNLMNFPWPIESESVGEARCVHYVEHIPHQVPGYDRDGWWLFFEEVQRILVPEGTIDVWHPYSRSDRAFYDPTHTRYIHETTWYYLDRSWREKEMIDHYQTTCDFEVVLIEGQGEPTMVQNRSQEFVGFAQAHYFNVYADLHIRLKKR